MAQDDRAVAEMFMIQDSIDNGINTIILPVKGVNVPLNREISILVCSFN